MPVYILINQMPYEELIKWQDYFSKRPIDWRDDDRTYKLLQAQGVKEKAYNIFPTLKALHASGKKSDSKFDVDSFKASSLYQKLARAQGGDQIL